MTRESILTLLTVIAIVLALYFLLTWLAKKVMPRNGNHNRKVTPFGLMYYFVFVSILFVVLALEHMSPSITYIQRYLLVAIIIAVATGLEYLLKKIRIKTINDANDKNV